MYIVSKSERSTKQLENEKKKKTLKLGFPYVCHQHIGNLTVVFYPTILIKRKEKTNVCIRVDLYDVLS